jgi:hypothetical protein
LSTFSPSSVLILDFTNNNEAPASSFIGKSFFWTLAASLSSDAFYKGSSFFVSSL